MACRSAVSATLFHAHGDRALGLSLTSRATAAQVAKLVGKARRPSVIWLRF
ncbi:MAG TPA: hypothetical protein VIX37_02305 [Candidatus Sulfotelmatobacter sp.]